jgi:hypothetical protein
VSHDLAAVQRFCDRVFWLDRGRLSMAGDATAVVTHYISLSQTRGLRSKRGADAPADTYESRFGDGRIRFVDGRLEAEDGTPARVFAAGSRVVLRLVADAHADCEQPVFGVVLRLGSQVIFATNTVALDIPTRPLATGERLELTFRFTAGLANGHYSVNVAVADGRDSTILDWINDFTDFTVDRSRCIEGIADLDPEFHCAAVDVHAALAEARRGS